MAETKNETKFRWSLSVALFVGFLAVVVCLKPSQASAPIQIHPKRQLPVSYFNTSNPMLDVDEFYGSSFTRYLPPTENPLIKKKRPIVIQSFFKSTLDVFWDNGAEGLPQGSVSWGKTLSLIAIPGHSFFCLNGRKEVARFHVIESNFYYTIGPDPADKKTPMSAAYRDAQKAQAYRESYLQRTGLPFLSYYPPSSPGIPFWPTEHVGQTHQVISSIGYFLGPELQSQDPVELNLKVLSTSPGPRVSLLRT